MDIISLGTCNLDFILKVPQLVELDGEMYVEEIHVSPGGSALNFAVKLSQQGINTGIMARIGNDDYSHFILDGLVDKNLDTSRLIKTNHPTGLTFINVDQTGKRSIYSFMGANANFKLDSADINYLRSSEMLHLTGMYWEVALEVIKHINRLSFAPGAMLSNYGMDVLSPVLKRTELLFLNEREVQILTGKKSDYEIDDSCSLLMDAGVSNLIVTRGEKGAYFHSEKEQITIPAKEVNVLDTTGAGDAFAAGFVSKWFTGCRVEECLGHGNKLASQCIQEMGAF